MKSILAFYNFTVATIFVLLALFNAHTIPELTAAALFSPLLIYFVLLILPQKKQALPVEARVIAPVPEVTAEEPESIKMPKFDIDRRLFLKLIASGGISLFFFSLFTHKAEKIFLGPSSTPDKNVPKDTIDGYQIAEIDDSTPAYFGYINKDGEWFIRKDDESGSFRYVKGSANFANNWANRAMQSYDYFSSVF